MHGGYGASIAGHAHPAIVAAVSDRVRRGTHFAQPTEDAIWVAGELARRFGLPQWRFANSGTEATMDAVHLMRAITGRDLIIKVEGCYHGHHDSVQVSVLPGADELGPRERPVGVAGNTGHSRGDPRPGRDRAVQRPGRRRARADRAARAGRGHDRRADHDECRHHPARSRLPRRVAGTAARARRAAHLRRGQDRFHHRSRRRHGALRRHPGHRLPRESPRRRDPGRGDRRHGGGDGRDRGRALRAGRHVQRQPAGHGRRPRDAVRGPHRRGVCTPGRAGRAVAGPRSTDTIRAITGSPGTSSASARRAA